MRIRVRRLRIPVHNRNPVRTMATLPPTYKSHIERTASSFRDPSLHAVTLQHISQLSPTIRLLRLAVDPTHGVPHLPGQWLDTFVPDPTIPKPGGFTITSSPGTAAATATATAPQLELAVQHSPTNPPAAWLWRNPADVLGATLHVRVGGSFVWPPAHVRENMWGDGGVEGVVMVAGGVGVNPFMSMVRHLAETNTWPCPVTLLYGAKAPAEGEVLFLQQLADIAAAHPRFRLRVFATGGEGPRVQLRGGDARVFGRRIALDDVRRPDETARVVYYVCGPRAMTDGFVAGLQGMQGVDAEDVLCEKWW